MNNYEVEVFNAYKSTNPKTTIDLDSLFLSSKIAGNKENHTMISWVSKYNSLKDKNTFVRLDDLVNKMGCDVNTTDERGWGCLVYAIRNNDMVLFNKLVELKNINLNITDKEGKSLAHHVVNPTTVGSYENTEFIDLLNRLGCNLKHKDNKQLTPYHCSLLQDSGRMSEILEKYKADDKNKSFLKRCPTNIMTEIPFAKQIYNYEEDADEFNVLCEEEARKLDAKAMLEKVVPDENIEEKNVEICYDDAEKKKPLNLLMVKVEISRGYHSGNVFYKMQIVREKVRGVYLLFTRWGRVSTVGQFQKTPFPTFEEARKEFCKIFKQKSDNEWENRDNFVKKSGKYRLIAFKNRLKYDQKIKEFDLETCKPSNLSKTVLDFLHRTTSTKQFAKNYKTYQINTDTFPLHSLTKETILDAQTILTEIENLVKNWEEARKNSCWSKMESIIIELNDLSSQFYEFIPLKDDQETTISPITQQHDVNQKKKMIFEL